jgi:hypothetical protein
MKEEEGCISINFVSSDYSPYPYKFRTLFFFVDPAGILSIGDLDYCPARWFPYLFLYVRHRKAVEEVGKEAWKFQKRTNQMGCFDLIKIGPFEYLSI